jgi:hypothetical protein
MISLKAEHSVTEIAPLKHNVHLLNIYTLSIKKTSGLMLSKEIICVNSENHVKHTGYALKHVVPTVIIVFLTVSISLSARVTQ